MVLGRHADHVHADDAHDGDLKLLVCDDLEQQKLELDLQRTRAQCDGRGGALINAAIRPSVRLSVSAMPTA